MGALHRPILSPKVDSAYGHLFDGMKRMILRAYSTRYTAIHQPWTVRYLKQSLRCPCGRYRALFSTPLCGRVTAKHEPIRLELLTLARNARLVHGTLSTWHIAAPRFAQDQDRQLSAPISLSDKRSYNGWLYFCRLRSTILREAYSCLQCCHSCRTSRAELGERAGNCKPTAEMSAGKILPRHTMSTNKAQYH